MSDDIGIFWDYENVRPLNDTCLYLLSSKIRTLIRENVTGEMKEKKLYYDSQSLSECKTNRVDLDMAGWSLIDCPKRNKKETIDKKIIVDIMCFVMSNKNNKCVCLISGDGDFSYLINKIKDFGVKTILIYPENITFAPLIKSADISFSWENIIFDNNFFEYDTLKQTENNVSENEVQSYDRIENNISEHEVYFNDINENNISRHEVQFKDIKDESIEKKRSGSIDSSDTERTKARENFLVIRNKIDQEKCNDDNIDEKSRLNSTYLLLEKNENNKQKKLKHPNDQSKISNDQTAFDRDKKGKIEHSVYIFLKSILKANEKNKNKKEPVLDALIADTWYRTVTTTTGTIGATTKEWYKVIKKKNIDLNFVNCTDRTDVPGHIIRYFSISDDGFDFINHFDGI
jgi:hypothetical protein